MTIKYVGRIVMSITFLMMCYGCLFPAMWLKSGYGIDITVPIIHKNAIASIRDTLRREDFELKVEKDFNGRGFLSYSKYVATDAQKVEHPYIYLTLSYDKGQTAEQVTSFSIGMGNDWDGKQPQLKQEMDNTANLIIAELKKLVGEANITVERKAIGPPF